MKWNIYLVQGYSSQEAFEVFQQFWCKRANPPAICVVFVSALAHPEFLVEIEAVAVK